jgi:hypothetical protein
MNYILPNYFHKQRNRNKKKPLVIYQRFYEIKNYFLALDSLDAAFLAGIFFALVADLAEAGCFFWFLLFCS